MKNLFLSILVVAVFIVGCANNAAMMKNNLSNNAIENNKGRIVFYRPNIMVLAPGASPDFLINGKLSEEMCSGCIFYFDIPEGQHKLQISQNKGGEKIDVKVTKGKTTYVKIYISMRTFWYNIWNIEEVKPEIAINEIAELP